MKMNNAFIKGLISVIIPVYNVEQYISRCLDSVIKNSYSNLEIICVNDGSTDASLAILEEYAQKDSRINIIDQKNSGVSAARNAGLRIAKGEYVAYVDSDDWIHKKYFEYLIKAAEQSHADLSLCDYVQTTDDDVLESDPEYKMTNISLGEWMSNSRLKLQIWKILFRHELIDGIRFNEHSRIEDTLYNLEVMMVKKDLRIAFVNIPMYAYYTRPGSMVTSMDERDQWSLIKHMDYLLEADKVKYNQDYLCREIIKRALAVRYIFRILKKRKKVAECNRIIKRSLAYYSSFRILVFYKFPEVYRLFRIATDRSMLTFEKSLKQRRS